MAGAAAETVRVVREADRDRYLSVLFAPEEKRAALFALYAFNVEIARVRDLIHEPLPGEIRLQWWRDSILGDSPAVGNPVAEALIGTIRAYDLPATAFDNFIEARLFDLYDDPMPSRTDLEGYCGETASALIQLAALVLDRDAALATAEVAGHAGCAQAIAGLLRSLPIHLSRGQCYVPRDVLAAAGTSPEAFVAEKGGAAAARVLSAMIALAREHFAKFEESARRLPPTLRPAYLPAALTGAYLSVLSGASADPFKRIPDLSPLRRYLVMARRAFLGWR
ncbi:MAG: phytoene/squalene synthase family protein [Rhizobiales bacterium 65-79]|jgi:phytoene synthase|nr:phytoene/squalene synthase family protein [Hyphomicrobiales bacterium]OJU02643.1 MAG: phytoene/squalene synthase family protein [Rhizobiales bacterium 65-79]